MTNKNNENLLTVSEVAVKLNLTPQAVRYRISKLKLETKRQKGVLSIDEAQFKLIQGFGEGEKEENKDNNSNEKDKYIDELIASQRNEIANLRERLVDLSSQNKRLIDLLEHEQELRARDQQVLIEHKEPQSSFWARIFGR